MSLSCRTPALVLVAYQITSAARCRIAIAARPRRDEFQNLAAQGMFVLFTNPRGSSGYGAAFTYSTRVLRL